MIRKFKNAITKIKNAYHCYLERKKLHNKNFCIISNNCWGGFIYQKFGLKYNTPTVGLFIHENDFVKFCANLEHYLSLPLEFIDPKASKNYEITSWGGTKPINFPIAKLDDIEIVFMHYKSEDEAQKKWERRKKRVNYNNLLFKMSERNDCNEQTIAAFCNLPHKNKICFTENENAFDCCVQVEELKRLNKIGGDETTYTLEKIDIYKLLNEMK